MYRIAILIVTGLSVLGTGDAKATMINFYGDGVIQHGDEYTVVEIFDDASVQMIGGAIETRVEIHDFGVLDIFGGTLQSIDISIIDSGTLNLWAGVIPDSFPSQFHLARLMAGSSAAINIYGYGFERDGDVLSGFWRDGVPFKLSIRDERSWAGTTLYVIPEPSTLLLIGFGPGLILRRRDRSRRTAINNTKGVD